MSTGWLVVLFLARTALSTRPFDLSAAKTFDMSRSDNLAMYWGVDDGPSLMEICSNGAADSIPLAFIDYYDGDEGPSSMKFNFGGCSHEECDTESFADAINVCHDNGKIVTVSVGGWDASIKLSSAQQGREFGELIYNKFLGGNDDDRPFSCTTLDGIDLDIEHGNTAHFADVVNAIRDANDGKYYYVTGAPQCPNPPDDHMKNVLSQVAFDAVYVQFYHLLDNNEGCELNTQGRPINFDEWDTWRSNSAPNKDMKIYIGAMGAYTNGEDTGYVDPDTLKAFIDDTRSKFSSFGGVMLWDAELAAGNNNYGRHVKDHLRSGGSGGKSDS